MKKQFVKNVSSGWLTVFVVGLVGFVTLPMNLKYLGKDLYGISTLAVSMLSIFSFLKMGMQPALLRFFSHAITIKDQEELRSLSSIAQLLLGGLGGIGWIGFMCTYPWFISTYQIPETVRHDTFILFLAIALEFWNTFFLIPFETIIQSSNRFDIGNLRRCLAEILRFVVLFIGYSFFKPSLLILAASIFAGTVYQLASLIFLAYKIHGNLIFFRWKSLRWSFVPSLFSFGVMNLIPSVFSGLSVQLPVLIIGKTLGVDVVAAFTPALLVSTFCSSVLMHISTPIIPVASKEIIENQGKNMGRLAIQLGEIVACVGCSIIIVFVLFGSEITMIWLGESYAWTGSIVTITVAGIVLSTIQGANWRLVLGGNGSLFPNALSSVVLTIVVALGTFLGTAYGGWSLLGVAVFIALARLVRNTFYLSYTYSLQLGYNFIDYTWCVHVKPLLLALPLVGVFYALKWYLAFSVDNIPILVIFSLLVVGMYLSVCWKFALQINTKKDILQLVKSKFNRANQT